VGTLAQRARRIHRTLGERQEQMLPLLAEAGEHGATSGDIARALDYDHANATITLKAMVKAGLLLKDESAVPYRFRLVPELLPEETDER
jgi:DNA-binding MarR family transcriptional regulator